MEREGKPSTSKILLMTDTEDEDGTTWRAVVLYADGCLAVQGFDTGPGVQRVYGADQHEFARDLSVAETNRVRDLLGVVDGDDLLAVIDQRFTDTSQFEKFLMTEGVPGTLIDSNR